MKLSSMITIPAVAMALATTPAFAENQPAVSITINGKTYTLVPGDKTAAGDGCSRKCKCGEPGKASTPRHGEPTTICGTLERPGEKCVKGDIDERMKELASDPDAEVVRDEDGNIKSVKVEKIRRGGKVIKDGKVVKSWGDDCFDEDVQKKIDEAFAQCDKAALLCGSTKVPVMPLFDEDVEKKIDEALAGCFIRDNSHAESKARAEARKARAKARAEANERQARAAKAKAKEARKDAERKAMQESIEDLRKQVKELEKRLEALNSAK